MGSRSEAVGLPLGVASAGVPGGAARRHVLVIGGGAAGMAAAIAAAREGARATVAERMDRVGRKLLATGNGRCNLSNTSIESARYHSAADVFQGASLAGDDASPAGDDAGQAGRASEPSFASDAASAREPARGGVRAAMHVMRGRGAQFAVGFFKSIGVLTAVEGSCRVYPRTFMASTVLDALRAELARLGVAELCGHEAVAVDALPGGGFETRFAGGRDAIMSDAVVIATGGRAAPNLGSDGNGYALLERLGHRVLEPAPALVQIKLGPGCVRGLKGVRVNALASLEAPPIAGAGQHAARLAEEGEFLFTEYGISGIPAMDLSTRLEGLRRARNASLRDGSFALSVDLFPEFSDDGLSQLILARMGPRGGVEAAKRAVAGFLHKRVAQLALSPVDGAFTPGKVAAALKRWRLPIVGALGFDRAQATFGGADLSDFCLGALESRLAPGLHAAGEILDVVGDCGGFNLHWAWASGCAAGQASAILHSKYSTGI